MSDLIRRQDALDAIQKRADIVNSVYSAFWEGLIIAYSLVQEIPSAEPERKCAKDARCTERAAKILNRSEGFYSAHGVCICGHCEQCGNAVCDDFHFCPYCGTKLDWSEA